ncbi:MAG: N-acetyltransferase [Myxococcota bacterium]|nr:N-acetyltransferase [Myxococcota bacterium]
MSFQERGEGVFVHPQALCESDSVGEGTRIWAFAHVMAGAVVGRGCNLCGHTFIEAGAVVGDGVTVKNGVEVWDGVVLERDVFVGPNATFTNDLRPRAARPLPPADFVPTKVEEGASLGANVTVVCGHTIGRHALVAAGAVVTRDVPAHALVAGNPARRMAWVCECGQSLDGDLACQCGRSYRLVDEHEGLASVSG